MRKQFCLVAILGAVIFAALMGGCKVMENKPLWERLEDIQYNSYKPNLDHLEQKYGEGLFKMDVYGQITLINPPHSVIAVYYDHNQNQHKDNYNIISRKVEFEGLMQTIVSSLSPKSKVNLANAVTTFKNESVPLEEFLVDLYRSLIRFDIYVPISDKNDCQNFYNDLIAEINRNKYMVDISIWFLDESVYYAVDSETRVPEKFIYIMDAEYDAVEGYVTKWTEGKK